MKKILILILFMFLGGCINMQKKSDKEIEVEIKSDQDFIDDQPFFELRINSFRKDGWFYSYHPEHLGHPENCVLLSKKAPEEGNDRMIYKIDCFDKNKSNLEYKIFQF